MTRGITLNFLKNLCMFNNIYKIRTIEHFDKLLNLNFYKPICCVFINKEFMKRAEYKNMTDTIKHLLRMNNYIMVLLVVMDDIEEFKDIKNTLFVKLYYKNRMTKSYEETIVNIIPSVTANIIEWNNSYINNILKRNPIERQEVEKKENTKLENAEESESNESLNRSIKEKLKILEEKQRELENL
jgi:hypothetical protein